MAILNAPISLPPDDYTAFVGNNDGQIGTLAADRMGRLLKGKGQVGIIGVSPMLQGSNRRENVFTQRLRSQFPGIQIVGTEYGLSDWARSSAAAQDLRSHYPNIDGIFASDSFATMASIAVLRKQRPRRHITLIGVDQEAYVIDALRQGDIDGVIATDWPGLGQLSMRIMQAALSHQPFAPHTEVPVEMLTAQNLNQTEVRRYLPPPLMTPAAGPHQH